MKVLAGDVGGTKTTLGRFRVNGGTLALVSHRTVATGDYPGLDAIVQAFMADQRSSVVCACFGVAAPVVLGRSEPVNLPWVVEAQVLKQTLGGARVWLINDMEATAYGIEALPRQAFVVLQEGQPQPQGAIAVLAAGTSLGEVTLVWDGQRYRALPSEGGHADFAPRHATEWELFRALQMEYGHVSYARVLSGPGLVRLYRFLQQRSGGVEPAWLAEQMASSDPSAVIAEGALSERSEVCVQALEMFVSVYGAAAGNLALRSLSRGGVCLGGGIAPKILPKLADGTFLRAFLDKGRLAPLLSTIPVRVIREERAALYVAAQHGWSLATSEGLIRETVRE